MRSTASNSYCMIFLTCFSLILRFLTRYCLNDPHSAYFMTNYTALPSRLICTDSNVIIFSQKCNCLKNSTSFLIANGNSFPHPPTTNSFTANFFLGFSLDRINLIVAYDPLPMTRSNLSTSSTLGDAITHTCFSWLSNARKSASY